MGKVTRSGGGTYNVLQKTSTAESVVEVSSFLRPTASLGALLQLGAPRPLKISRDEALEVEATVESSGDCKAPPYYSWWVVGADGSNERVQSTRFGISLRLRAPLPVLQGTSYALRLLLAGAADKTPEDAGEWPLPGAMGIQPNGAINNYLFFCNLAHGIFFHSTI